MVCCSQNIFRIEKKLISKFFSDAFRTAELLLQWSRNNTMYDVASAYCNSGDKDFWGLFDFYLCSSTSKSTPSFSRRLFSSDKEGLEEEISDSRQFWKTRLRISIVKPPGQHEEGEGVSKVRFVFGLHHRGNIRVRLLVRPDMS